MSFVQAVALVLTAICGTAVVAIPEPDRQALASGLFGVALAVLFLAFQAPDVALSQIVVGGVVVPAMVLLTVAKVRRREVAEDAGEGAEPEETG